MTTDDTSVAGTTDTRETKPWWLADGYRHNSFHSTGELADALDLLASALRSVRDAPLPGTTVYLDIQVSAPPQDRVAEGADERIAAVETLNYAIGRNTPKLNPNTGHYGTAGNGLNVYSAVRPSARYEPPTEQPDATLTAVEDAASRVHDYFGPAALPSWATRDSAAEPQPADFLARDEVLTPLQTGWSAYDATVEDEPHEHGCTERAGLGFLPDVDGCTGCEQVATLAAGYVASVGPLCGYWHYSRRSSTPGPVGRRLECVRPAGHHLDRDGGSDWFLHRDRDGSDHGPWFAPQNAEATAATVSAVLDPDAPITDAERVSAALDAKAAEAASEGEVS